MPFTSHRFAVARPYLFHLTARENVDFLRETRALFPAATLLLRAGERQWIRLRRPRHIQIMADGHLLRVRDQMPLHEGNMLLSPGYTFSDFIEDLNRRVFFWPGRADGFPIDYGNRHFQRYTNEAPVILRLRTDDTFHANAGLPPEFCRYNSGSPRCSYGKRSPRGPDTFQRCDDVDFTTGGVVEVTFPGPVQLPQSVEWAPTPAGSWSPL